MSRKTPHTATRHMARVWVRLRDGRVIVDRFVGRTPSKYVVLEKAGRIKVGDIASFGDFRARAGTQGRLNP